MGALEGILATILFVFNNGGGGQNADKLSVFRAFIADHLKSYGVVGAF